MHKKQPKKGFPKRFDEITLLLIVVFIAVTATIITKSYKNGDNEAEKITESIFSNGNVIDGNKIMQIQKMDYPDLKKSINAKGDFCIYLEDDKGQVILAKGTSKLSTGEVNCRE